MESRFNIAVATASFLIILAAATISADENQSAICNAPVAQLLTCAPAVTKGPNPPMPSPDCCKALSVADLKCICKYLNDPRLPPQIDRGLAKQVPGKCKLTMPPC
ncbi:putative lipid-transfer protein DIR1 [Andrographis paniculata]|uniref:putative lipid-transfer protein DIR1 n=1 Tax=Andrographis paniculata TaxID=175694 RepID=UPI0021E8CA48|nr:putative lipid-transfer protein DIR1 [Andrographis paniculata]